MADRGLVGDGGSDGFSGTLSARMEMPPAVLQFGQMEAIWDPSVRKIKMRFTQIQ
jgi:hypothetical protein